MVKKMSDILVFDIFLFCSIILIQPIENTDSKKGYVKL